MKKLQLKKGLPTRTEAFGSEHKTSDLQSAIVVINDCLCPPPACQYFAQLPIGQTQPEARGNKTIDVVPKDQLFEAGGKRL